MQLFVLVDCKLVSYCCHFKVAHNGLRLCDGGISTNLPKSTILKNNHFSLFRSTFSRWCEGAVMVAAFSFDFSSFDNTMQVPFVREFSSGFYIFVSRFIEPIWAFFFKVFFLVVFGQTTFSNFQALSSNFIDQDLFVTSGFPCCLSNIYFNFLHLNNQKAQICGLR